MTARSKTATMPGLDAKKYARVLAKYQPRIPVSEADHEALLKAIESLFHKDMTAEEAAVFDLMSALADQYAREHYRMGESSTPLSILRTLMEENQMKLKDLVEVIGTYARASEIVSGKREITVNQARKLGEHFHIDPALFLGL